MSLWLQILLYTVCGIVAIAILVALIRSRRPIRTLAGSGAQGLCALAAVNIAGIFTGISLGLNLISLVTCVVLGVPGVVALLILKTIFR